MRRLLWNTVLWTSHSCCTHGLTAAVASYKEHTVIKILKIIHTIIKFYIVLKKLLLNFYKLLIHMHYLYFSMILK